jgi:hypothetical protein
VARTAVSADGDTGLIADRTGNAAALGTHAFERRGRLFYWVDRKQWSERVSGNSDQSREDDEPNDHHWNHRSPSAGLSRRTLLKATAGTAALLGALQTKVPGGFISPRPPGRK